MSLSKHKDENLFENALKAYIWLLQEKPVLTKSVTSAVVSVTGNVISQLIVRNPQTGGKIAWRSTAAYASFGFFITGPVIHHFYSFLESLFPNKGTSSVIKKVLFDRFVFTPPLIFLFLYVVAFLEGHDHAATMRRIKDVYWIILKINWKIWTVIQFINLKYVPLEYRVLFGNTASLLWTIYISYKRRQMSS